MSCDCPSSLTTRLRIGSPFATRVALALGLSVGGVLPLAAQPGTLFPEPFVVEHRLVQSDGEGSVFAGDPVTDYYGGSWIVSVRGDGSRMVVDLGRQQLTEIRPADGTFWSVTFDDVAALRSRYLASELGADELRAAAGKRDALPAKEADAAGAADAVPPPEVVVREVPLEAPPEVGMAKALAPSSTALLRAPGVRHLRVGVRRGDEEESRLDVWVDSALRLGAPARRALEQLETRALAPPAAAVAPGSVPLSRLVSAAREHANGAVPLRTVRPVELGDGAVGTVEDVALRVELLASFPLELVEVPGGLREVAHPLARVLPLVEGETGSEALRGNPLVRGSGEESDRASDGGDGGSRR